MQLKLTAQEMQEVRTIAEHSAEPIDRLLERLERLTWGDGSLEGRMQSSVGLPPWMEQLQTLSDRINRRLQASGIPLGPSVAAYQAWEAKQKK